MDRCSSGDCSSGRSRRSSSTPLVLVAVLAAAALLFAALLRPVHSLASYQFPHARLLKTEDGALPGSVGLLVPLQGSGGPVLRGRSLLRSAVMDVGGSVREVGYFFATVGFGTPARQFQLILDTGSTITYVPCADCKECGSHHHDAPFDPKSSSSALQLPCSAPKCNCGSPPCQCFESRCRYSRHYAENSASEGYLLEDVMVFPDTPNTWPSPGAPPPVRVVFGCESVERGEIYRQEADGLMGLGNNNNALQSQLVAEKVIEDNFYLCFGFPNSGVLLLGDVKLGRSSEIAYTGMQPMEHTHYYTVTIDHVKVGGQRLNASAVSFAQGYGAVLDSGTTFTYLPTAAFKAFAQAVEQAVLAKGLKRRKGVDPAYNDICYSGAPTDHTKLGEVYPEAEVVFAGGTTLRWRPLQYLFLLGGDSHCLGVFDNGAQGTLLGGIAVRDVLVQYDRRTNRAGFLQLDSCKDVHKLVEVANPPMGNATTASTTNTTQPSLAPPAAANGTASPSPPAASSPAPTPAPDEEEGMEPGANPKPPSSSSSSPPSQSDGPSDSQPPADEGGGGGGEGGDGDGPMDDDDDADEEGGGDSPGGEEGPVPGDGGDEDEPDAPPNPSEPPEEAAPPQGSGGGSGGPSPAQAASPAPQQGAAQPSPSPAAGGGASPPPSSPPLPAPPPSPPSGLVILPDSWFPPSQGSGALGWAPLVLLGLGALSAAVGAFLYRAQVVATVRRWMSPAPRYEAVGTANGGADALEMVGGFGGGGGGGAARGRGAGDGGGRQGVGRGGDAPRHAPNGSGAGAGGGSVAGKAAGKGPSGAALDGWGELDEEGDEESQVQSSSVNERSRLLGGQGKGPAGGSGEGNGATSGGGGGGEGRGARQPRAPRPPRGSGGGRGASSGGGGSLGIKRLGGQQGGGSDSKG